MDIQILSQTNMDNKKTLQNSRKNEKYINHTEKINNMNLQILSQTNMDNSQTEYGHSQTETWTF